MNWLAHLLLSEPTPAFRLGGILPDLASASALAGMPPEFQGGIRRHHQIDAYTDSHAIFRRSVHRFSPPFRRFGGILVDVFYDHFLASDWESYSDKSLPDFTSDFYASFESHRADIPPEVYERLLQMKAGNWLCSYGDVQGVATTLGRIGSRLRRPFDLAPAIAVLERDYKLFHGDFTAFFPEVTKHVQLNAATTAKE
ncbi:MAG: hypothetical protein JWR26_4539 [Pedosphaera sp.]|nr:hypothetical protein [Pedosphaera sp.]